ncbi:MAG TPA: DUF4834 family protein [Paludibacter sp.]|nr:DUF4834 family protein [Paludibacter sp.]
MSFLFFILVFLLFIGLFIILSVANFIRSIFTFGKRKKHPYDEDTEVINSTPPKAKIFDKKEGEYVDFEEISDDK